MVDVRLIKYYQIQARDYKSSLLFSLTDERLDERDGEQSAAILFDLYK